MINIISAQKQTCRYIQSVYNGTLYSYICGCVAGNNEGQKIPRFHSGTSRTKGIHSILSNTSTEGRSTHSDQRNHTISEIEGVPIRTEKRKVTKNNFDKYLSPL